MSQKQPSQVATPTSREGAEPFDSSMHRSANASFFDQSMHEAPDRVSISAANVLPTIAEPTAVEDFTVEEVRAASHHMERSGVYADTPKHGVSNDSHGKAPSEAPATPHHKPVALSIYPPEVLTIARQMRGLDQAQFLMLAELTQQRAWTNVYSMVGYRGTAWYLPNLRPLEENEPQCGVGFNRSSGIWMATCGWRLEVNVVGYLVRIALLVALWLALWANFPDHHMELGGLYFDPIVAVLFATIVGGILARLFRVPPLICVLWMAIMWHNIPTVGYFTKGIDKSVRSWCLSFGLNVILIRAGLYIKAEELKPMALLFLAFTFLPAIMELIAHSFMAKSMFDYPDYNWAFTHGAVAAVVSPAVVVPALLSLKLDGFGLSRGPGMLMMPAAPAEMVAGVWNINFMNQLTLDTGDRPLWLNILLGPLQIIGGAILGAILGVLHYLALKALISEATKLPTKTYTTEHMKGVAQVSTAAIVVVGVAVIAYTKELNLSGGGAVAVTMMGAVTSALIRKRGYESPYYAEQFKLLCMNAADLWDTITMPVLFTMVGTVINLGEIFTADFFPKMLACIAVGLAARVVTVLAVTARQDYDVGERAVMAVGWCGKATVQAAVGRAALERARKIFDTMVANDGLAIAERNLALATQINNAAVLMILVCAPIAALTLARIGPKVMRKEALPKPPGTPT
uniref:Cation/H+ exchanger domain-containing protein n=1 Tax=Neobodo designis TaxID=312471 RepID=A0A7S1R1G9_NEODS|mmetsp:Transcript_6407/g.20156  ORF Transcript_6407/g.20156 Transcript_6407/m.20156 type:complete len:686 (+) Transcript_6407:48-2105(+)